MIVLVKKTCIYTLSILACAFLALFISTSSADAATLTWDGGGGDNNWSTALNWDTDGVPVVGDDIVFDGTSTKDSSIDSGLAISYVNSISINSGYTGTITMNKNFDTYPGGFTQAAGTFVVNGKSLEIGNNAAGTGSFTITGGVFNGDSTGTDSTMKAYGPTSITGGTVTFPGDGAGGGYNSGWIEVHNNFTVGASATVDFNGGSVMFYDNSDGSFTIDLPTTLTFAEAYFAGDSYNIADGDTMIVAGDLIVEGDALVTTGTGSEFHARGDITGVAGAAGNSATTILINGTGNQAIANGSINTFNVEINKTSGNLTFTPPGVRAHTATFTLTAGDVIINGGAYNTEFSTFTMDGGTLTANSDYVTFTTAFVQNGGDVTVTDTFANDGTATLNGGTFTVNSGGLLDSYAAFTVDGGTLTNNGLIYSDVFTLNSGTFDLSTGEMTFYNSSVANNGGTVVAGASSYTDTDSSLSALNLTGDWNFYDFTSTDAGLAITLTAGSTITVANDLLLTGGSGNEITLASSSPGTQWNLNATTPAVSYVNVTDSNAAWGTFINPTNSTDGGNNSNWFTPESISSPQIPSVYEPTGLIVEDYEGGLKLTWEDPTAGEASAIKIFRGIDPYPVSGVALATVSAGVEYYVDTNVQDGDIVTYQLKTVSGNTYSSVTEAVTFMVGSSTEGDEDTGEDEEGDTDEDTDEDEGTDENENSNENEDTTNYLEDFDLGVPDHWAETYYTEFSANYEVFEIASEVETFLDAVENMFNTPNNGMNRGEVVEVLLRVFTDYEVTEVEVDAFSDIDDTYERAYVIEIAANNGLVEGHPDGTFRPDVIVNRAEALKMAEYFFGLDVEEIYGEELLSYYGLTENPFVDVDIEAWYAPHLLYAYANGVVHGYDDGTGRFGPADDVTYAEFLKIASLTASLD